MENMMKKYQKKKGIQIKLYFQKQERQSLKTRKMISRLYQKRIVRKSTTMK